uniref:Uncharacterized protein n=1 Tax=Oryza punctata TaxID=4537 RepID=A0A0E0JYA5_ORYPU
MKLLLFLAEGDASSTADKLLRHVNAWFEALGVLDGTVAWHAAGTGLVPTPKHPADRARVTEPVSRLRGATSSAGLLDALHELRDVAAESERNRKLLAAVPGAVAGLPLPASSPPAAPPPRNPRPRLLASACPPACDAPALVSTAAAVWPLHRHDPRGHFFSLAAVNGGGGCGSGGRHLGRRLRFVDLYLHTSSSSSISISTTSSSWWI